MAAQDYVSIDLPNGDTFEGAGNLRVSEIHQPRWLIGESANEFLATSDKLTGGNGRYTEHVFAGAGSALRRWRIDLTKWEGETGRAWGGASASDDVIVKLQTLGDALASTAITSRNPATFSYGEYSSGGQFEALNVVPGEVELPTNTGPDEQFSVARPKIDLVEAAKIDVSLHDAWDNLTPF